MTSESKFLYSEFELLIVRLIIYTMYMAIMFKILNLLGIFGIGNLICLIICGFIFLRLNLDLKLSLCYINLFKLKGDKHD